MDFIHCNILLYREVVIKLQKAKNQLWRVGSLDEYFTRGLYIRHFFRGSKLILIQKLLRVNFFKDDNVTLSSVIYLP